MIGLVRAAALCATLALGLVTAQAADKAFKRDDLADSAIKLEAQIKSEAGPVAKTSGDACEPTPTPPSGAAISAPACRSSARSPPSRRKTAATGCGWPAPSSRSRRRTPASRPSCWSAPRPPPTSPISAPAMPAEEADALAVLGRAMSERKLWRPALDALRLSLDLREVADVRGQYEKMRDEHGFRAARLHRRFGFGLAAGLLPVLGGSRQAHRLRAVRGAWPATTSRRCRRKDKQLCVEGLKHGERYNINLRAGLPSTVKETLPKSAEFNIYVRDRKPFVRFTGRAYVLPRTGQRGIPAGQRQHAGGDRQRVPDRRPQPDQHGDRQRLPAALSKYQLSDLGDERGVKVWSGELATATTLNQDVTTAFPVDQALGDLQPGVYVMTAAAKGPAASDDDGSLATQWFIVSDLGLTAFSGNDGIHVFVNSLASTDAVAKAEVRLVARNNEILATRKTDAVRPCAVRGRAGARRGRSCRRRC